MLYYRYIVYKEIFSINYKNYNNITKNNSKLNVSYLMNNIHIFEREIQRWIFSRIKKNELVSKQQYYWIGNTSLKLSSDNTNQSLVIMMSNNSDR